MFLRFKRLMHFKHFTHNSVRPLADKLKAKSFFYFAFTF